MVAMASPQAFVTPNYTQQSSNNIQGVLPDQDQEENTLAVLKDLAFQL